MARRQKTIQHEFLTALILTSLIPLLVTNILLFNRMNGMIKDQTISYGREITRQTGDRVDTILSEIDIIEKQLIHWAITNSLFDPGLAQKKSYLETVRSTQQFISNIRTSFPYVTEVYFITSENAIYSGQLSYNRDLLIQLPEILQIRAGKMQRAVIPPHPDTYKNRLSFTLEESVISFVNAITDYSGPVSQGIILIDVRTSTFDTILGNSLIHKSDALAIMRGSDIISLQGDIEYVPPRQVANDEYYQLRKNALIVSQPLDREGWMLAGSISRQDLSEKTFRSLLYTFATIIVVAILAMLFTLLLSRRLTRPITTVLKSIDRIGEGDLTETVPDLPNQDLHMLAVSINTMTGKINELMLRIREEEKLRNEAVIETLQAQINPHFLYNTLDVMRGISLERGVPEISEISKSLAKIFRYSITTSAGFVTIRDELAYIRSYITIYEYRFGSRFQVLYHIDEQLLDTRAIRLILQPIVENAFHHGIGQSESFGEISIALRVIDNGERVELTVTDSGIGIPLETLRSLQETLLTARDGKLPNPITSGAKGSTGMGLLNVNRRLIMNFGPTAGLTVTCPPEGGTMVSLIWPVKP